MDAERSKNASHSKTTKVSLTKTTLPAKSTSAPQKDKGVSEFTRGCGDAATLLSVKLHLSPRNGVKKSHGERASDTHPLNVAFKNASSDYRRHLYQTASLKTNNILKSLLTTLHESIPQTVLPSGSSKNASTSPLKFEGQVVSFDQTLEIRMLHYEALIAAQTEEVTELQKAWQAVVGEIRKLGAVYLGEKAMQDLLFAPTTGQQQGPDDSAAPLQPQYSSSPSKSTDVESTLFVPEHGISPLSKQKKYKYGASNPTSFPHFLYQPSQFGFEATLYIPHAEFGEDIQDLYQEIEEMGDEQVDDFVEMEKEQHAFWKKKKKKKKKKTVQLASAL
ncbi:hypothetical protein COCMIDRAFT_6875 [Bipolaris oryzae ATCC 44560]|uniref:Uncharacterized protein n=1 Tax=Bipolaris oryzae ATCC 44560 TaxID=930090 RepID=W6Z831_COCMI|nr:uncharacterized protein COCMIDRAFT_6875 [Bipolaris oryzae ATCC 44560]EUC43709.1 hypothetical protein COCMIDRAFT_6875 [Bipolaris oryzae ATCC 44560]